MSLLCVLLLLSCATPLFAQQFGASPIVPMNSYGSQFSASPFGGSNSYAGASQFNGASPYGGASQYQQPYPIHPINGLPQQQWPPSQQFGGQNLYRHGSQSPFFGQPQQPSPTIGMSTLGGADSINPINNPLNAYSNQMPSEQPNFASLSNRRASMPPIQVVYGKPVPMEMQSEQASQPAAPSSSSSSLPLFLQGAPEDVIDEYKKIIRKPNSNYDDQVKEIDQLVLRLDGEKQKLYKEFMQENDDREQVHRDKIHKNVGEMSEKAQEQFAKISALLRNSALPNEERWGRVLSLYGKLDTNLRNEFEDKFKDFNSNQQQ